MFTHSLNFYELISDYLSQVSFVRAKTKASSLGDSHTESVLM